MSTPFASASAAYGNAARLISERAASQGGGVASTTPSGEFGQMLADQLAHLSQVGQASDQAAMAMVNGQGSVVDMVTALAAAESTMETMVTVRDRVISAYEEIMRMPI